MEISIKETKVNGWNGWIKIQIDASRRYVSPTGIDISDTRFKRLSKIYKDQKYIPEAAIMEDIKKHPPLTSPS